MKKKQERFQEKLVVVTRSKQGSARWLKYFHEYSSFTPYYFPTIEVVPIIDSSPELVAVLSIVPQEISSFEWLVFTSANAVHFFTEFLENKKIQNKTSSKNTNKEGIPKIAAIGEWTENALRDAGFKVAFVSSNTDAKTLAKELPFSVGILDKRAALKILLLRAAVASSELVAILEKRGARVTDLPVYQTKSITRPDAKFSRLLAGEHIGCVTFASSSSVEGFRARVSAQLLDKARALPAIAISQQVGILLKRQGFTNVKVAKKPSIEGIVAAIRTLGL
jgi:uroporphyrinogen III methyltransferase/synthase